MNQESKLLFIKSIHTIIWVFFNVVIFYLLYAVIINKIGIWVWILYRLGFNGGIGVINIQNVLSFNCNCSKIFRFQQR